MPDCRLLRRIGSLWLACLWSALTAVAAAAEQFPGLDAKWRVYESPHFELFSRVSESESREMLRKLEGMRAVFLEQFGLTVRPGPRVTIYAFNNVRLLKSYLADETTTDDRIVGGYRVWPDRDVIALSLMDGHDLAMWVVYSNYTKHLLTAAGGNGRPSWVYQGLSMLLGNFELSGQSVYLGSSDPLRSRLVRENPKVDLSYLLRAEEGRSFFPAQDQANIFHAQSWGLLHYLYVAQSEVPQAKLNEFLRFVLFSGAATDPEEVERRFVATFGIEVAEMERRVSSYFRRGSFTSRTVPLPKAFSAPVTVRALDVTEMRERLAELRLRNRRDPAGKFVLLEALEGPRGARAAEALGTDAIVDGDDRRAQEYWVRAASAGSSNPTVAHLAAQMEFARWFARTDVYFRLSAEKTDELRRLLRRSIELVPTRSEPYEALAWVEAAAPQPDVANVNLVQRQFPELREQVRTLVALALVRARLGDPAAGLKLLTDLHEKETAGEPLVAQVRAHLEKRVAATAP